MDVARLLLQTIYTAARTGTSATGVHTYAAATSRAARVEYGQAVVREGQVGTTATATATIITINPIGPEDRVWLPGDPVTAIEASLAAPENTALAATAAALARLPSPPGCQPGTRLTTGTIPFYQTTV